MNYPQVMTGVNVFVDGFGHLGTSKTVTLPKITEGVVEVSSGGLTREIATGTLEKLECSFTLQEYSPYIYAALAAQKALDSVFILKANILQGGDNKSAVAIINGHIKEIDDGDWEAKKEIERKITLSVKSYALEIDGTQGIAVDVDNLIYLVDGVDFLESVRQNLQ
jgi:P2 family phage contractile tail tube protein